MPKGKRRIEKKTARIYYGPDADPKSLWWTVIVKDAVSAVKVNGSLAAALAGAPGTTIGCHLSVCVRENRACFGHDCYLASFTKTSCLIVNRVKNGKPTHATRYSHSYGDMVELNDRDKGKRYIKAHPELAEREFWLRPPRQQQQSPRPKNTHSDAHRAIGAKTHMTARGVLKRAIDAGFVSRGLIEGIAA